MFRDYSPILLSDCTAEVIGFGLPRSNHEASLLLIEQLFGWVSTSDQFVRSMEQAHA
jgi:ureidoacrylate peracid hydrolase